MDIKSVVQIKPSIEIPELSPGDTVKVSFKIKEGDKERIQVYQGVVIAIKKGGIASSLVVRRVTYGVGIERTFFFYSPTLDKIEVIKRGQARRAKLYYLRGLSGKASRIKEKGRTRLQAEIKPAAAVEEPAAPAEQPVAGRPVANVAATAPEQPSETPKTK